MSSAAAINLAELGSNALMSRPCCAQCYVPLAAALLISHARSTQGLVPYAAAHSTAHPMIDFSSSALPRVLHSASHSAATSYS